MNVRMSRWMLPAALLLLGACAKQAIDPNRGAESQKPSIDPVQVEILLGATAKRLCSSLLVSGRTRDDIFAEELNDSNAAQMSFGIDRESGVVTASILGQAANVLYRPGIGCTLAKGASIAELRAQFDETKFPEVTERDAPWPLGNEVTLPSTVDGVDLAAINAAVDGAFEDIEDGQNINTRAVLIARGGQVIAERYAPGFDAATPQLGWSMTKTVTNILTGMLVGDGRLDVNANAPVPEWREGDSRQAIRLTDLMHMSSGLEFSEVYTAGSLSDVILMLYTAGDTGGFTASKPLTVLPDTLWYYSSGTTNLISRIHRQTFDDQQAYFNFPRERLFNKLGMASAVIEPDASGVFVGSSYMYATPRDWAKIGQFLMQDGVWDGERLLPEGWVDYSLTPAKAAPRGGYGAQVWLNRGAPDNPGILPHPELPASMFYLSGFEGQNVVVVPEEQLVVVRMGLTRSGPRPIWRLVQSSLEAIGPGT